MITLMAPQIYPTSVSWTAYEGVRDIKNTDYDLENQQEDIERASIIIVMEIRYKILSLMGSVCCGWNSQPDR
jgi:hypothetical protein